MTTGQSIVNSVPFETIYVFPACLIFIYSVFDYQTSVFQTSYSRIALWLVSKEWGGYWTKWLWPTLSYCPWIAWRNWEESCKFVTAGRQPVIWTLHFPYMKEEAHERNLWWTKWRCPSISIFSCHYHSTIAAYSFVHSPFTDAIECQQAKASLNSRRKRGRRSALLSSVESSAVLCATCFPFLAWEDNFVSAMLVLISRHIPAVCWILPSVTSLTRGGHDASCGVCP